MSIRARKVGAVVGLTNTGKTTQIMKMIKNFKHGKVLILDKFDEPSYKVFPALPNKSLISRLQKGIYRIHSPHKEEQLLIVDKISEGFQKNGLIVLEDASAYVPVKEYKPLMNIFAGRRHKGWDTILTFHSINRIPPFVLEALDFMILFKTNDNAEKHLKESIPQPQLVVERYLKVEKHPDPHFFDIIDLRKSHAVKQ